MLSSRVRYLVSQKCRWKTQNSSISALVRVSCTITSLRSLSSVRPTQNHQDDDDWQWLPSFFARLVAGFGMVHVVSEYGAELTLCDGPSMLPTLRSSGEIILLDRLTPRIYGIQGGCVGEERAKVARQKQEEYEKANADKEEACKWHQVMIPANKFPSNDKWQRFCTRLTTGISVGDVVVVQHPQRQGTVCKRVLGLPGDMVVQSPSSVFLRNNRRAARRPIQQQRGGGNLLVIPDGHIWIEGDNSLNSFDSRGYGAVPAALIVGRVVCRIWPLRGNAMMERGWRPLLPPERPCTGSTILPAGYEGEEVLHNNKDR